MKSSSPLFTDPPVRLLLLVLFITLACAVTSFAQTRVLDNFESLEGWKGVPSDGAKLTLVTAPGKTGKAMEMDFDLSASYGYTIARKEFPIDLPSNYRFTFDMKADAPVNNFEFKLVDSLENVWWIKKLNIDYPKVWTPQSIRKRQIVFAWGPSGNVPIRRVKAIEFVVSTGTGGKGKVWIDNFRFEQLPDSANPNIRPVFTASSIRKGFVPRFEDRGNRLLNWAAAPKEKRTWMMIDFGYQKEIGALAIDWKDAAFARAYDVQLSDDGKNWNTVYSVTSGNGGRDNIYLPEQEGRMLKILVKKASPGGVVMTRLDIKGPSVGSGPNAFFSSIASGEREGLYPEYLLNRQCFWTVVGTNGDTREALINELGTVEVDQERFSLEPFLLVGGKLVTWKDVTREESLEKGYLPIPSVTWTYGGLKLTIRAFSAGTAEKSNLLVTYTLTNNGGVPPKGKLFVAIRPFQVNPPWQSLFRSGGFARIDSIRYANGLVYVQDKLVIPMSAPDKFGATGIDGGDITDYLVNGNVPDAQRVADPRGFASAALLYDYDVQSGGSRSFQIAVPFHSWNGSPTPGMRNEADTYTDLAHLATVQSWESKLDCVRIILPPAAQPVVNTIKSNIAYIFINRDGPMIQPGSRSYERSWIRDGALTSTALLQMGVKPEVKEFIDWYSGFQFASGKIPCVVDYRGADPTVENDSHGEYIYAVMQYFRYTGDTAWLRGKWDHVVKTVRAIQSLRAERKTDVYRTGTPVQQACYGLLPESISHEGYSAHPMHSYWDDFFALRGLKDATAMAGIVGDAKLQSEFAAERDDMSHDLYTSMRLTMQTKNIDYIPGCAELGDFDATSTTIGINPVGELGVIPEPQLHNTFDRYYDYFSKRRDNAIAWKDYTPYENRVIGSFVYLDEKDRAQEVMNYFMKDRHPAGWNHWAEVVYRDSTTPKYIGDMPHTWCGSDFIRSVRAMFVYERDRDSALVVGAGVPETWLDGTGMSVKELPTYYGLINYTMKKDSLGVTATLSGQVSVPKGKIVLKNPLATGIKSVTVNGRMYSAFDPRQIVIEALPANIEIRY
jgi:hypothetical protein